MSTDLKDLTLQEIDIILHASGYSKGGKQYRTHYCCSPDDPKLRKLVCDGYFSGPKEPWDHGYNIRTVTFNLTKAGLDAAEKLHEWRRMP